MNMLSMTFQHPQLLVLLLLLPFVWSRLTNRRLCASTLLRLATAVCGIVFLAGPVIGAPENGRDVIVLVDRSASAAARTEGDFHELLPLVQSELGADDRLAVVAFGREPHLEKSFAPEAAPSAPADGNDEASNLADAIAFAADLSDPARRTALLYLGDGQYSGATPRADNAPPFWFRRAAAGAGTEVAVRELTAPGEVQPGTEWTLGFSVFANAPVEARYTLSRNAAPIASGTLPLRRGENYFQIRDEAPSRTTESAEPESTLLSYRLRVEAPGDAVAENDTATALTRIAAPPRVLHVTHAGKESFLAQSLAAAAIPVETIRPEAFPHSPAELIPYATVILENTRLSAFPRESATSLAAAVESGVTSLLVTGGQNSFGNGGYHRSALDPLLPVEMELRNELRRGNAAIAIALDRSGSMAVPAGGGRTKMDLANLGAAESLRLLAENDQAAIIAVDSQAHTVIPLVQADQPERLAQRALTIESMGGGIFVRTALEAAYEELKKSTLSNRHIILFADAEDAEEQEGAIELTRTLREENNGVSVVAMGEPTDVDAKFLVDLAKAGGGEALFSRDAEGLPALFTQEVMRVSKRGFAEERVAPQRTPLPLPGIAGTETAFPEIDGYNIAFPREGSDVLLQLDDEYKTPILAARTLGKNATAALLFEAEGKYSGAFTRWRSAPNLLAALVRRLAPQRAAEGVKAYARMDHGAAQIEVEFGPETAERLHWPDLTVRLLGTGGKQIEAKLRWTTPDKAEANIPLNTPGHFLPVIDIPGEDQSAPMTAVTANALSIAYPAEFVPGTPAREEALLRTLAAVSGGGEFVSTGNVLASARTSESGARDASAAVLLLFILLFLIELSGRRLRWFS